MTLYDRILVPTDGSAEGERAVAHALDVATVHDATVHAIYVVDTASYAGMPMESSWEGIGDLLRSDAADAVERVKRLAAEAAVDVETAVVDGSPSRETIRYTEDNDCDLVVMGTHGRGGIDRLLLGSVAEKVVRGASVPVLTVRLDGEVPKGDVVKSIEAASTKDVTSRGEVTSRGDTTGGADDAGTAGQT